MSHLSCNRDLAWPGTGPPAALDRLSLLLRSLLRSLSDPLIIALQSRSHSDLLWLQAAACLLACPRTEKACLCSVCKCLSDSMRRRRQQPQAIGCGLFHTTERRCIGVSSPTDAQDASILLNALALGLSRWSRLLIGCGTHSSCWIGLHASQQHHSDEGNLSDAWHRCSLTCDAAEL